MDLANTNADPSTGQRPDETQWDPSPGADPHGATTYPLDRPTAGHGQLDHPVGVETRPALGWVTTFLRPIRDHWPHLGGAHGQIATPNPAPNLNGDGRVPWRNWNPRTFRNMPAQQWDAGTEIGS